MEQNKVTNGYATPKHVFLHLLMIVMLYVSVIGVITLYFQYINELFFDAALGSTHQSIYDAIRWGSSAVIVAYPVLVYTSWLIHNELSKQAELRQMKTRRWLLYFTQFITAITIIIDLMTLIYQFYGGEITSRFICKVLVVLIVAAAVLGYYHWELHRTNEASSLPKLIAIVVGVVLMASIASGFFIAGTPAQQRNIRLDEQRINNLMELQNQVVNYVQSKSTLPIDLTDLKAWSGTQPVDPETQQPFIYHKTTTTTFQLCATFGAALETDIYGSSFYGPTYPEKTIPQLVGGSSWLHPAGDYCFDRTITLPTTTS